MSNKRNNGNNHRNNGHNTGHSNRRGNNSYNSFYTRHGNNGRGRNDRFQEPFRNNNNRNHFNNNDYRNNNNSNEDHRSSRRGRAAPYDPANRSRQSSRVRRPWGEQENIPDPISSTSSPSSPSSLLQVPLESNSSVNDNNLGGWDSQPRTDSWQAHSNGPSLSRPISLPKVVENDNQSNNNSSNDPINDGDDEINDWIISDENVPSNSLAFRPQSPMFTDFDKENFKKGSRHNKGKSRIQPRYPDDEEDGPLFKDDEEKDDDNYKGVSFPPPFPIVPVTSATDLPNGRPKVDRIFENESQSSAQVFESLSEYANKCWGSNTDVPLELAMQLDDINDIMKFGEAKGPGKKNIMKPLPHPITIPSPITPSPPLPYTENLTKKDDVPSSRVPFPMLTEKSKEMDFLDTRLSDLSNPVTTISQSPSSSKTVFKTETPKEKSKKPINPDATTDRPPSGRGSETPVASNSPSINRNTTRPRMESKERERSGRLFRSALNATRKYTQTSPTSRETRSLEIKESLTILVSPKRTRESEEVFDTVDRIFRAHPHSWLSSTLSEAHKLIPKIEFFDKETIQKLLKILSSQNVLNSDGSEKLIKMCIGQSGFFEKVFSYTKEEINTGSDLAPIIRLTDFIVKLSPDTAQKIPYDDIHKIYMKVESTFSEVESNEVSARLKDIEERISKNVDQSDQTDEADQADQADQSKYSKARPDWIIRHNKNRIDKPLVPLHDEIFNLSSMITEPTLTSNYADQPWSPEYEEVYRQVHYDLLRTEVVEDLQRASVAFFAANCKLYKHNSPSPLNNYVFYNDVRVIDTSIDRRFTPYVRVGFKPSRPVDWIKGEHLIYGTFVLLFKKTEFGNSNISNMTMIWATVEHFNLGDVIRPSENNLQSQERFVGLNFSLSEFEKLNINEKYIMLESTRNYASIRPVMQWLKESKIQKIFPLHKELLTCCFDKESNITPGYLENVSLDITSILVDQNQPFKVTKESEWPSYSNSNGPTYNMELSCIVALKQIISRKVAVIMAPVVTSKAIVISKAVEFLHQAFKQSHCFEPIIILTRSSYALDNILEQLLPLFPNLIRYGSPLKCNNPALKSRQIETVANEHLNSSSRKASIRREWQRIFYDTNNIQKKLSELWKLKKHIASEPESFPFQFFLETFVETSPKDFKDQLVPALKAREFRSYDFKSEKAMFIRCLELWLSGEPTITENLLRSKQNCLTEKDFPAFNSSSCQQTDNSWTSFDCPTQGTLSRDAQDLQSLLSNLSQSYLFENEEITAYNYDEISTPSAFDKEILDHQIGDRVMSEEGQLRHFFCKRDFASVARDFWNNGGPSIWSMKPEGRKNLFNNFLKICDSKICDYQKDAMMEAEKARSFLIARWTEVCNFTPVIGMTMNYATAYREVLTTIKPRVCIVDEASEILESQLMFSISSDRLEHLIMFGDIQYSMPDVKSSVSQKHGLDVSLFKRWIKCGGENVCLKQQSRMHPVIHELVSTLYDYEKGTTNVVAKNIPKIMGVPSHVFFMTHNNFDRDWKSFKKCNHFEAKFIVRFAYYLYQQGYDPAKITILTPYLAQKLLILESLKPELKQEILNNNIYGRFDKERDQIGKIKVELIDNYNSDENQIVLLSLVTVGENWHKEALKTLDNKKRAIIALSRALNALYIFGDGEMLRKSRIWSPVVQKLNSQNMYGQSLILACKTHLNQKIEISTLEDFENKVPFGGCSEPCHDLLKCGHACPRKCHPIQHIKEINYICHRPCGRNRGCEHSCPKECHECEKSGKCPPCEQLVWTKLRCGHTKSIQCHSTGRANYVCEVASNLKLECGHSLNVKCHQKHNEEIRMTMECKEMIRFVFSNCSHSVILPCSTRHLMCQETCGKELPCGHNCNSQCGTEHSHERSDCPKECTKSLICGHKCANGCSEPDRHTSFCNKQCRIKCLHGRVCPKPCYEACTRCLELCPWKCPHYRCTKKCNEACDRPPCQNRCNRIFECGHQCNGFCGEKCPPCLRCNPDMQCTITLSVFSELSDDDLLYVLPECNCVFTAEGLDLYFKNKVKTEDHNVVKLWQCPGCQEPVFTAMRYNKYLKSEIKLWNAIKQKQEEARSLISSEERKQIINAMNEETRSTDFNSMVGGRWFVCPNEHPYYIGSCGGATQVSKCPDCSEVIGGTQHRVVATNRFFGEFDNSKTPAWPGQH